MATSMRPQTAMSTKIPGAVGSKPREPRNPPQATREPTPLPHRGFGAARKRAVGHQPLAEGRRRLAIQSGECAWFGKPRRWRWLGRSQVKPSARTKSTSVSSLNELQVEVLEDVMSLKPCRIALSEPVAASGADHCPSPLAVNPDKPSVRVFASPDDAGNALQAAAKSGDQNALLAIFGPDSKEHYSRPAIPCRTRMSLHAFAAGYGVMHRWRKMPDGSTNPIGRGGQFPLPNSR